MLLALAIILSAVPAILSSAGLPDPLKNAVLFISSPFCTVLDRAGSSLEKNLSDGKTAALTEENRRLAEEIAELQQELSSLQDVRRENDELRLYLGLKDLRVTFDMTEAKPFSADTETGKTFMLDRGSRDGVEVNQPVINSFGLIGYVSEVNLTTCKVRTLQNDDISVGAMDAQSGVCGVLGGVAKGEKVAKLQYIEQKDGEEPALAVGDTVVTSGFGEKYPRGLLIGRIVEVGRDAYDRSLYALVELFATGNDQSVVMIVSEKDGE